MKTLRVEASRRGAALLTACIVSGTACNDPVDPRKEYPIDGFAISGQANGTDPVTGETLSCVFMIEKLPTGGPLVGTWTDTVTVRVIRFRGAASQSVTYDTTIVAQKATISIPDSSHIQFSIGGPLTDTLSATLDPAYPGYGQGDWTCGPEHPLSRVQPDVILTGRWNAQPIIDLPIG